MRTVAAIEVVVRVCRSDDGPLCKRSHPKSMCLQPLGQDDECDGLDQDCDGRVDEGISPPVSSVGLGLASVMAKRSVSMVKNRRNAVWRAQSRLRCDGIDDDCDRRFDEAFVGNVRVCGVGACQIQAAETCVNGEVTGACEPMSAGDDSMCDGADAVAMATSTGI